MRRWIVSIAASVLLVSSAFAADLDANEKKWLQQCVDNLVGKSDRCRASAEKAIAGLGLDALPAVVAATGKLKTDADWQAMGRAIAAMGAGAGKALDGLRMSWPKGTEKRFADMLDFLEKAEEEAAKNVGVALPTSPADVEAAVRAILDGMRGRHEFSSDDPEIKGIVALGHGAVGALLKFLKEGHEHDDWAARAAAKDALAGLADEFDVPAMVSMLRQGNTTVAKALANVGSKDAVAAIVDAIDHCFIDSDMDDALEQHAAQPKVLAALVGWLKKPAAADKQFEVGQVAKLLAAADVSDAVAPLNAVLTKIDHLQPRQFVALALTELGEKSGIPVLIDVLTMRDAMPVPVRFDYPRHCAGLALNKISGQEIYTGKEVGGGAPGPGHAEPRYDADFPAAAKAYRDWWAKAKDSIKFDAATHTWKTS